MTFHTAVANQTKTADSESDRRSDAVTLNSRWIACSVCDELYRLPILREGEVAKCGNCHSVLMTNKTRHAERTLALMVSSLIVYLVAITFPFMRMDRSGFSNEISVTDAVLILWRNDMQLLSVACALLILVFPLLRVVMLSTLATAIYLYRRPNLGLARFARLAQVLEPWSMVDIFMLGVIVSLVKVGTLVDIALGAAFWGMVALVVFLTLGAGMSCRDSTWRFLRGSR
ncbi:MAG: paraquat-inducible protein A [Pseudomonadota bacterium]